MPETLIATTGLLVDYPQTRSLIDATSPSILSPLRDRGFKKFTEFGIPTTKDEEFRYISLKILEEEHFKAAYGAIVDRFELSEKTVTGKIEATTLAFINGQAAPELSHHHALPEGIWVGTLEDALLDHEDLVMSHIGKIATLDGRLGSTNDERFCDLNSAFLDEGAVIVIEDNVELDHPIHLQFISRANHGLMSEFPRTLILVGENSAAKVIESYVGLDGSYFSCPVTEVYLAKSARLEHVRVQDETSSAVHVATLAVTQEEGSTYTSNSIHFGSQIARLDVNVYLQGENIASWLNGVSVGTGSQVIDNHTRIDHAFPNCNSFEVYKSVLDDEAKGVFNGKIFVYQDAQKTDAKQTNKAVLLSRKAAMDTKPQLEIFADDVKCTHGATIGQLSAEALFYLQSRGIPLSEARSLLVYAFAAEVMEKISIPELKEALETKLLSRLGTKTS